MEGFRGFLGLCAEVQICRGKPMCLPAYRWVYPWVKPRRFRYTRQTNLLGFLFGQKVQVHVLLVKSRTNGGVDFKNEFNFRFVRTRTMAGVKFLFQISAARKKMISRAAAKSKQGKK